MADFFAAERTSAMGSLADGLLLEVCSLGRVVANGGGKRTFPVQLKIG